MYLFKNYAIKGWIGFAEVYGMPLRVGKYEPGWGSLEKCRYARNIRMYRAKIHSSNFVESVKAKLGVRGKAAEFTELMENSDSENPRLLTGVS